MSTTATHINQTAPATNYGPTPPPGSTNSNDNIGGGGSSSGGGGSGGGGGGNPYSQSHHGPGPCGACKFLRRKCVAGCIFAPYFDSDQGAAHFAAVHKVFGASNVSKLLLHIPAHRRLDAVVTICYEAQARLRDPVHGCVAHIFNLQQQVMNLQTELTYLHAHLSSLEVQIPPPHQALMLPPQQFSISDLPPPSSSLPTTHDLTSLFDPLGQQPPPLVLQTPAWETMQQHNAHIQRTLADARAFGVERDLRPSSGEYQSLAPWTSSAMPLDDEDQSANAPSSSVARMRD